MKVNRTIRDGGGKKSGPSEALGKVLSEHLGDGYVLAKGFEYRNMPAPVVDALRKSKFIG